MERHGAEPAGDGGMTDFEDLKCFCKGCGEITNGCSARRIFGNGGEAESSGFPCEQALAKKCRFGELIHKSYSALRQCTPEALRDLCYQVVNQALDQSKVPERMCDSDGITAVLLLASRAFLESAQALAYALNSKGIPQGWLEVLEQSLSRTWFDCENCSTERYERSRSRKQQEAK